MRHKLKTWYGFCRHIGRMLVGMPDYDNYLQHMRSKHPQKPPMGKNEFYKNRLDARYGGGKNKVVRCC